MSEICKRVDQCNIYYLDEAGMKSNEVVEMGWSQKGTRCYATRSGKSAKRWSFISAISAKAPFHFISSMIYEGSCTRQVFETWLIAFGEHLRKQNQSSTHRENIIILDNAAFHKGGEIEYIAEKYGLYLVYLPPYSPELNPIEKCWAVLKAKVRRLMNKGIELYQALTTIFKSM